MKSNESIDAIECSSVDLMCILLKRRGVQRWAIFLAVFLQIILLLRTMEREETKLEQKMMTESGKIDWLSLLAEVAAIEPYAEVNKTCKPPKLTQNLR